MNKLTADKARYFIDRINAVEKEFGLSIDKGYFRQALEIALPILEQQERGELVRVAFTGSGSLEAIKRGGEGFIWGNRAGAHPIELFIHAKDTVCQKCNGTGEMDSGGTQPWGEQILIECDCQIEQQERGEWIEWKGGECPVGSYSKVETRLRCGLYSDADEARLIYWNHTGRGSDIIAYRIIPERATNHNGEQ